MIKYILLLLCLSACKEKVDYSKLESQQQEKLGQKQLSKLPDELWHEMDIGYFAMSMRGIQRTETQTKVALANVKKDTLKFQFYLIEKTPELLTNKVIQFSAFGAASIDLSKYIRGTAGDFEVAFQFPEEFNEKNLKIFFLPNVNLKDRNCQEFYEISSYFFANLVHQPQLVTLANHNQFRLLNGTFVFVANIEEKYYMGQLNVLDSRYSKFFCRG